MKQAKIMFVMPKSLRTSSHDLCLGFTRVPFKAITLHSMCSHNKVITCGCAHSYASVGVSGEKVSELQLHLCLISTYLHFILLALFSFNEISTSETYLISDQNFEKGWCCKPSEESLASLNLIPFKHFPGI